MKSDTKDHSDERYGVNSPGISVWGSLHARGGDVRTLRASYLIYAFFVMKKAVISPAVKR